MEFTRCGKEDGSYVSEDERMDHFRVVGKYRIIRDGNGVTDSYVTRKSSIV